MRIGVVGCGHVGAVVAACFAETGHPVVAFDVDEGRIAALRDGRIPFYEPGLQELVERNVKIEGRLGFTTDPAAVGRHAEVVFFCVGTPPRNDGHADLRHLFSAAEAVAREVERPAVFAIKSSVPVGTTEQVAAHVARIARVRIDFAFVPEFLKEGDAVRDLMKPDRVVVGASSPEVIEILRRLHEPFLRTMKPFIPMDIRSAELAKYASNFLLATRISAINEIAALCERTGADVEAVRRAAGADSRIGHAFLFPGVGYGGSCFPKDLDALIRSGERHGIEMRIARAVQQTNRDQRKRFAHRIAGRLGSPSTVAIWGLAFKPRTDDLREAPAVDIIAALRKAGIAVHAYDPRAMAPARRLFGSEVRFFETAYEALDGADALVLLTEWEEFRMPNFEAIKARLRRPILFDGRNIWDPARCRRLGFEYFGIGRP